MEQPLVARWPSQRMLTLILKGEISVQLTSSSLLVRNQLFQEKLGIFFHYQNNLILTAKDKEVSCTDTSPFIKGEFPVYSIISVVHSTAHVMLILLLSGYPDNEQILVALV